MILAEAERQSTNAAAGLPALARPLSIFVHRASQCLTDHESHGDGLICFSLLNGLAERGHSVYAYTNRNAVRSCSPRLHVVGQSHKVPANSLADWEHAWRAERWLARVRQTTKIDLVWRMHPYGGGCPRLPRTFGSPLVVGPLFYDWPDATEGPASGKPRFGIGLKGLLSPLANRGWRRTLNAASLVFCATRPHAEKIRSLAPAARVEVLPVIVDPPPPAGPIRPAGARRGPRLIFVANLVQQKNPIVFCQTIERLRAGHVEAEAVVVGDGPERASLEDFCQRAGIKAAVTFIGKVPSHEVFEHVRDADLLISTSRGEPYGRNIVEAMSVGTPCVCHRSGGPQDIIEHGVDGLLAPELTPEAYAAAITAIWRDPLLLQSLASGAAEKARLWASDRVLSSVESSLMQLVAGVHRPALRSALP